MIVVMCSACVTGIAQTPPALSAGDKLRLHANRTFSLSSMALSSLSAGYSQTKDSPTEWGQGVSGYSKRLASSMASSGVRSALAFGLEATLHQDPRYFRSENTGFWARTGHTLRGTILTRTDRGGETLSTWRLGSAYGSAFLVNLWYPDRFHTARHGLVDGTIRLGSDLAQNAIAEFWPDIKRRVLRRKL